MNVNPFRIAKWVLEKFWYWLGWSLIFFGLMFVLTSVGNSQELMIAYSFGSFWITTSFMDRIRERWNGKLSRKQGSPDLSRKQGSPDL